VLNALSFPRIETWGLVGQGHALSGSSTSRFSVRNNPWLLRGLRLRAQKATGRAWPCHTIGPVPEVRKLSGIAHECVRHGAVAYSSRSVSAGFRRAMRSAGSRLANAATSSSPPATLA
jgi:hypothetical protein